MKHLLCLVAVVVGSGICLADDKRDEKQFKGVELYSWKDKAGDWVFILVEGTNGLKQEEKLKADKRQVKGMDNLRKAFAKLAEGEHVYWSHHIKGFEFPPAETKKEIKAMAKEAKIDLQFDDDK
jgi:hypothetical protein